MEISIKPAPVDCCIPGSMTPTSPGHPPPRVLLSSSFAPVPESDHSPSALPISPLTRCNAIAYCTPLTVHVYESGSVCRPRFQRPDCFHYRRSLDLFQVVQPALLIQGTVTNWTRNYGKLLAIITCTNPYPESERLLTDPLLHHATLQDASGSWERPRYPLCTIPTNICNLCGLLICSASCDRTPQSPARLHWFSRLVCSWSWAGCRPLTGKPPKHSNLRVKIL